MAKNPAAEMPFLDHLEELRWRIVWSLGALVVGLFIGFWVVIQFQVIRLLQAPILPYLDGKLKYTNPVDPFSITLNAAIILGLLIASPVIIYHVWAFLSPALHRHEKKVVIPVIIGAVLLFAAGVGMAFFYVLPMMLGFLMTFQSASLEPMITAQGYFSIVTTLALTFGAAFELPVLVLALAALGLVTPALLSKFRPYAYVLAYVMSAFVTPGDFVLVALSLAVPLCLLYEISVILAKIVFRKRQQRAFSDNATESLA
jgi:sec-independent protein translocase protein TatC